MAQMTKVEIAELYAAYCELKTDATRHLLASTEDEKSRENIKWVLRVIPLDAFARNIHLLESKPDELSKLVRILATGWKNRHPEVLL